MKKKVSLGLIYCLSFILIVYFGNEATKIGIKTTSEFISLYLDHFHKYLLILSLFIALNIHFIHIPYLNPEIKVRTHNNTFVIIWSKYLLSIVLMCIYLILSFFLTSLIYGFSNVLDVFNHKIIVRLFIFILSGITIYNVVYNFTRNHLFGLGFLVILNLVFLSILLGINFYVLYSNPLQPSTIMNILNLFSSALSVLGLSYLFFSVDKKECLRWNIILIYF